MTDAATEFYRRMRNEFRELALGELLPRAFIKRSRTFAYFDADASLLIVDSASDRAGWRAVSRDAGRTGARTMSAFTQGPWIVSHDPDGSQDDYCIGVPDGKVDQIAVCSKRDAALIAAAPDMYAALCDALEFFEISGAEKYPVADKARAALAKAVQK